jgi:galactose-6-phosphate isomerase
MPFLDVSDVLTDPDFCDNTLVCERNSLSTDSSGRGVISTQNTRFSGVVTSDKGELLQRGAVGEHATDNISVITRFKLRDAGIAATADIVQWNGKRYTVTKVNVYSTYGIGFTENICDLIPLAG